MYTQTKPILEKRRQLIEESRGILNAAANDNGRPLTPEESTRYDAMFADIQKLTSDVERHERMAIFGESAGRLTASEPETRDGAANDNGAAIAKRTGFSAWLQRGNDLNADERRDLMATTDSKGGYTFAPEQFLAQLIQAMNSLVFMRSLATVIPLTASDTLGVPTLASDPEDPDWTTEIQAVDEDTAMAFGKRLLAPIMLSKLIKVSLRLLNVSALNPEQLVLERFAYKFGVAQEKAFLTGTGTGQPLGIYTASANGISTARDVSAGNTATAVTMDGLLNALYSVNAVYRRSPSFAFIGHRDTIKAISKFRDDSGAGAGTGGYLWEPSAQVGEPDRIKGVRVYESEFAPNTYTTGLYVGIFGDLKYYWIADLMTFALQRLVELYAVTNQVGFIGRMETDGAPVLEAAFARVKLG